MNYTVRSSFPSWNFAPVTTRFRWTRLIAIRRLFVLIRDIMNSSLCLLGFPTPLPRFGAWWMRSFNFQFALWKYVLVFFDDILIYSPTWLSHLEHLETVLHTLRQQVLFVKLSKCSFGLLEVDYLGHTVSGSGVSMDKGKVQAVLD